jgi:hypothetical protein
LPGKKKAIWGGTPLAGEPLEEFGNEAELPIIIPDHDPGRIIIVQFTREQARDIGMTLWKWGSE